MSNPQPTLGIISQNVAGNSMCGNDSSNVEPICDKYKPHMSHDILVICRQEVNDKNNTDIVSKSYLTINRLSLASDVALNPSSSKNLKMAVYTKDTDYNVQKGIIPIDAMPGIAGSLGSTFIGYTKGAVWVKLTKNGKSFLFVNVHAPMNSGNKGLSGLEYRTKSFKSILTKIAPYVDANTYLFVIGDLNYRMDIVGKDQLDDLLATGTLPVSLTDISPPSGQQYTCKFNPSGSIPCRHQIIRPGTAPSDLSCFDPKRSPSRCDRILVGDTNLEMIKYETFTMGKHFDHNGIYAVFNLPNTTNASRSGPATRKKRYNRRKTRRHYL
jgi:endonuclease/exonuclease/phosphatase family metal-dependent hydrolase